MTTQNVAMTDRGIVHEHEVSSFPGDNRVLLGRSYISWSAVIAGSLTALALLILSASFANACGVPAYRGSGDFGIGAAIWSILSFSIAFFVGGCLVSYLSPHSEQRSGIVHGMMAWVLSVLLMSVTAAWALGSARGVIPIDPFRVQLAAGVELTHAQIVGIAWTAFLSLTCGLIFAVIGGSLGYSGKLAKMESTIH